MAIRTGTWQDGNILNAADLNDSIGAIMKGPAEQANKILKATGIYENRDITAADNFTVAEGINGTVITDINPDKLAEHVIIEATDVTIANFNLFDCKCVQIENSKWILFSNAETTEERRSQIYATLFYGSNSTDGRVLNSITGLTSLKTSIARDVGKRAHIGRMTHSDGSVGNRSDNNFYYNANFVNTTDNNYCSAWAYLLGSEQNRDTRLWFYYPDSSFIENDVPNSSTNVVVSSIGQDTSAFEANNPSQVRLRNYYSSSSSGNDNMDLRTLILCNGGINWDTTGTITTYGLTNIDFFTEHSIPDFTLSDETINIIGTSATFSTTLYQLSASDIVSDSIDNNTYTSSNGAGSVTYVTYDIGNKLIPKVEAQVREEGSNNGNYDGQVIIDFNFLDGSTSSVNTGSLDAFQNWVDFTFTNPHPTKEVESLVVRNIQEGGSSRDWGEIRNIEIFRQDYNSLSEVSCDTNILPLDSNVKGIQVFVDSEIPTGTSISLDILDGTNTLLSDIPFTNKFTGVQVLSGVTTGDLQLTFKLNTTDTSITPKLKGYGVTLIK